MQKSASLLLISILSASLLLEGCVPMIVAGGGVATSSASSSLSLGAQIDDTTIKAHASRIINQTPGLQYNSNVEVAVFSGIVLLLGQVPSPVIKASLGEQIAGIKGVVKVYNQLEVGSPISFDQYANDSWITARVATKFLGKVNPSHFKIVTENGVVYLMGVTTKDEGNQAAEIASEVPGVVKVVKAFTYIQAPEPAEEE